MRGKRGSLNYVLSRTVDIIFSALIVLLILFIVFMLYNSFWAEDKLVKNQYVLVGDMLQGVIEAPGSGSVTKREFAFTFLHDDDQKTFEGTLFALSSDGTWTSPMPPINWYTRDVSDGFTGTIITTFVKQKKEAKELSLKRVDKACKEKACLCLSTKKLVSNTGDKDLLAALKGITECRAFDIPSGASALFIDFEKLQRVEQDNPWYLNLFGAKDSDPLYDKGLYPKIALVKAACEQDPKAICIYGSMGGETTT